MDPDGANQVKIADSSGLDFGPTWSADGRRIAFVSERDGNREIYVMNADGTGQTRLTNSSASDFEPAWSPDNETIVFRTQDGLSTVDADGGATAQLITMPGVSSGPAYSPDGSKIVFKNDSEHDAFVLYVADADGSDIERLTAGATSEDDPSWSPDGERIAFVRTVPGFAAAGLGGPTDIFLIDPDGDNETNITDDPEHDSEPHWAPDGGTIAFVSSRDQGEGIYLMNPDGSERQFLLEQAFGPNWQALPEGSREWGDADCSGAVDPVDALKTLRHDAGLSVEAALGCPVLGSAVDADGSTRTWGDVDCSESTDPIDALKVLRHDAGLAVAKAVSCPIMADLIAIS
jgi:Tol biopolymer transport system component